MDRIRLLTNLIDMCIGAIQAGLEWSPSTSSPSAAIGNSSMWSEVIGGEFSAYEQPLACSPNAATGTALICSIHRRHRSVELNQFLAKIDSRVRLGSFFIESTPRDTSVLRR